MVSVWTQSSQPTLLPGTTGHLRAVCVMDPEVGLRMAPEIPCSELLMRLGDDEVLVLDCREDGQWLTELQIPGALRMSLAELPHGVHALPDDELIVVCGDKADG